MVADSRLFEPRTAIVTGGSSGIGQACAIRLAEVGMDVGVTYHTDAAGADETKRAIRASGRRAFVEQADLSNFPDGADVVDRLIEQLGSVDIMVANAGDADPYYPETIDVDAWRRTIDLDLNSAVLSLQKAALAMIERGRGGRLIAITSVHDTIPAPFSMAYTAAKHGLRGAVSTMALRLMALHGITANCIAPGEIATDINDMDDADAQRGKHERPVVPAGRPGASDEIAHAVVFLASAKASFVNGAVWDVDGGMKAASASALHAHRELWLKDTGRSEFFDG